MATAIRIMMRRTTQVGEPLPSSVGVIGVDEVLIADEIGVEVGAAVEEQSIRILGFRH
jgi:hypothetical protein